MTEIPRDGSYYHQGRRVYRAPLQSETGITLGFLVCVCNEDVTGAAEEIVEALNAAESKRKWDAAIVADRERNEA